MNGTYLTGVKGEEIAERYLTDQGMVCLERRYREKCGEIDLIMKEGDYLVFVEVKARFHSGVGNGFQAVNVSKQRRIARCAMLYLMKHHQLDAAVRFDVVEVNQEGVFHIPNAFQPGGMYFR